LPARIARVAWSVAAELATTSLFAVRLLTAMSVVLTAAVRVRARRRVMAAVKVPSVMAMSRPSDQAEA
jgi:hypothetical protein